MKKSVLFFAAVLCALQGFARNEVSQISANYPITPVPFTSVKVDDGFWNARLQASRDVTIPLAFRKSEETGRIDNFVRAAHPSADNKLPQYQYDDSDVYKVIEGAAYSLQTYPDKRLERYVDSLITLIVAAQEADGYLYTARTCNPTKIHPGTGKTRWEGEEGGSHELYCFGHLAEAAVAYWQATGKRALLDATIRFADCICREVGPNPGQAMVIPGHQGIELAMVKLYLATGKKEYLDEVRYFIDYRGKTKTKWEYIQSHKPVADQTEVVGHAVRAMYLYSGVADLAALTGDENYIHIIDRLWDNIANCKLYITGGIGATANGEAFGKNYELPNETAYNETCAAIGLTFLNQRLFLLHGESKYIDMLERTLYNGLLSGVSVEGNSFFYPNPLACHGGYERSEWFGCACCPSNICRFIPSLPGYVYAVKDKTVYANLFLSNRATLDVAGKQVVLSQQTGYPYDGDIAFTVEKTGQKAFDLAIRIPGWVKNKPVPSDLYTYADNERPSYEVRVNGQPVKGDEAKGYLHLNRQWKKGDKVSVHFDMPVRTVKANPQVKADNGMVCFERGPIVYCAETADNPKGVFTYALPKHPQVEQTYPTNLFGGKQVGIRVAAQHLSLDGEGYVKTERDHLTLVPYHLWDHRGAKQMKVWFPQGTKEIEAVE